MTLGILGLFAAGVVAVVGGAELVVRGGSRLARALGMSPLLVGLTLVAFGTSAPEVAVSVEAAMAGRGGVALGNVAGSNIFNVLVVLGVSALVAPLTVERQLVRMDVPVMIVVATLPILFGLDRTIDGVEGVILLGLGVIYTATLAFLAVRNGQPLPDAAAPAAGVPPPATTPADAAGGATEAAAAAGATAAAAAHAEPTGGDDPSSAPPPPGFGARAFDVLLMLAGLTALVVGAEWFITSATEIARAMGISELVIGLTLVAAATSLPELATSLMAAYRGQRDLAVGNAVGSNIFNVLFVLGAASAAAPDGLHVPVGALTLDLPVGLAVAAACLPVFFTGWQISRWEGAVFVAYYVLYMAYLLLDASTHDMEDEFVAMIVLFVLPLTLLLAGGGWWWGRRDRE